MITSNAGVLVLSLNIVLSSIPEKIISRLGNYSLRSKLKLWDASKESASCDKNLIFIIIFTNINLKKE